MITLILHTIILICSDEWREIFMKQPVSKCRYLSNFCDLRAKYDYILSKTDICL